MTLNITCTGAYLVDFTTIKELQGNLKIRSDADVERCIKSIIIHGFSFPFFLWKNKKALYAFDGHGRKKALKLMSEKAYRINEKMELYIDHSGRYGRSERKAIKT